MNTYKAFYHGKSVEIKAENPYKAQLEAAKLLKAKHSYDVAVVLVALEDGKEIIHVEVD